MTNTNGVPQVFGISEMFFNAFDCLPENARKKVLAFIPKFRKSPNSNGLNLEKLQANGYWSARVDDNYRVIVFRTEDGKCCLLLWVDSHDEAYRWAKTHVCHVNSVTGSLQVYETVEIPTTVKPVAAVEKKVSPKEESPRPPIFSAFSDEDLLSIGIPKECLYSVRSVASEASLQALRGKLPTDAFESLCWLSDGETLQSVRDAYGSAKPTKDWAEAIQSERSQRSFRVIEDDEDMRSIMNASLEEWRVFLHPMQKKIVTRVATTPMIVRGAAGTGKTVVAMHRAVNLIRRPDWNPKKKLLFTTFTVNLVADIRQQIGFLCTPEEMNRIEVTHVNGWVSEFLRRRKVDLEIVYPDSEKYEECWQRAILAKDPALRFSDAFIREEWNRIVLPNNIETESEYLQVSRRGRGVSVSRRERKALWKVFEEMRNEFSQKKLLTAEDACFRAIAILDQEGDLNRYGAVVVDETQDMGPEAIRLLAKLATPKEEVAEGSTEPEIFLVGDGHQRIYSRIASLSACGINVRGGRSKRLKVTYRTTEEIRKVADAVLLNQSFDDMDEGKEVLTGTRAIRHGQAPEMFSAKSFEEEIDWIEKKIEELTSSEQKIRHSDICIVTRVKKQIVEYRKALETKGYKVSIVARNKADDASSGLRIATMHRVKGLEFKAVFIVGANEGVIPYKTLQKSEDESEVQLQQLSERSLFYVAASRARDALFLSCSGQPGEFFRRIWDELH